MFLYFGTFLVMMMFFAIFRSLALRQHEQDRLRERDEQAEKIALNRLEEEQLQKTVDLQEQALKHNDTLESMHAMNEQLQKEIRDNEQRLHELKQQDYPTPEQLQNLLFKVGASGYDQTPYKHLMKTYNALHIYPEPTDREDK